MLRRKPDLPSQHHDAWWGFVDCADVIEGGRRVLLGTLPTGRVEPAPITVGTAALRRAIDDARAWMPAWRLDELADDWDSCQASLNEALKAADELETVAASTGELEELLGAVQDVIEPLDAFADAERSWRRQWKLPRQRGS